jgi:uncharacterized membrane protein
MNFGNGVLFTLVSVVCLNQVAKATVVFQKESFLNANKVRHYYTGDHFGFAGIETACAVREIQSVLKKQANLEGYLVNSISKPASSTYAFEITDGKNTLTGEALISGVELSEFDHNTKTVQSEGYNCHLISPSQVTNNTMVFKAGDYSIKGMATPTPRERHLGGGRFQ